MAQDSRPVADFAAPTNFYAGSATFPGPPAPNVSDLYETVDEAVASDADGIVLQSSGGTAWFTMDALSAPSELFLYLRSGGHNSSGVVTTASLYEPDGTTLIDSQMFVPFADGVLETKSVEFDISGGISDPSALVIKLEQGSTLGSGGYVYTTQLYLYDSGSGSGGSSGGFSLTDQQLGTIRIDLRDNPDVKNGVGMTKEFQARFKDDFSIPRAQFKYADPKDASDAANGQTCTESGYWFPGHRVRWVNGKPFGDIFAPDEYDYQLKGPNAWDFE